MLALVFEGGYFLRVPQICSLFLLYSGANQPEYRYLGVGVMQWCLGECALPILDVFCGPFAVYREVAKNAHGIPFYGLLYSYFILHCID